MSTAARAGKRKQGRVGFTAHADSGGGLRHLPVVLSRWLRRLWRALRASAPKFWAINPAAVDLVDVEVEEITVDAGQAKTPSGCGALDPVWDEAEFRALRQAGKDAELTASAGSVRAYLKRISKVVLQEVDLAKAIEAGLFAAEWMRRAVYPHSMSREIHLYSFSAAQTK